jgi:hypothetical protein
MIADGLAKDDEALHLRLIELMLQRIEHRWGGGLLQRLWPQEPPMKSFAACFGDLPDRGGI